MIIWAHSRGEFSALTAALSKYSGSIEETIRRHDVLPAYCRACDKVTNMRVTLGEPPDHWRNLLEGMVCNCGLNGRARLILSVLDILLLRKPVNTALILERLTALYPHVAARIPGLTGTEWLGDALPPGSMARLGGILVRSENMMALTFPSESLDLVMHFDILEHISDWRAGLRECERVLRPGAHLLFTSPFYDALDRNIIRAEVRDGQVHHLLPPAYHANPVSSEGSLVFIHPSWEVYDYLRSLHFKRVDLALCYDPLQGIVSNGCPYPDGHMYPVVFVACK